MPSPGVARARVFLLKTTNPYVCIVYMEVEAIDSGLKLAFKDKLREKVTYNFRNASMFQSTGVDEGAIPQHLNLTEHLVAGTAGINNTSSSTLNISQIALNISVETKPSLLALSGSSAQIAARFLLLRWKKPDIPPLTTVWERVSVMDTPFSHIKCAEFQSLDVLWDSGVITLDNSSYKARSMKVLLRTLDDKHESTEDPIYLPEIPAGLVPDKNAIILYYMSDTSNTLNNPVAYITSELYFYES